MPRRPRCSTRPTRRSPPLGSCATSSPTPWMRPWSISGSATPPLHWPQHFDSTAVRRALPGGPPPEDGIPVQLRVVTDQPWDVPADLLVVPVASVPVFDGPLGELNRRAGGELQALVGFGELNAKRYSTAPAAAAGLTAGRILLLSMGDPARLDREVVVRLAATAERRLAGRAVKRLAIWLSPLADGLAGGAVVVAGLVARGVVEGSYDPRTIYRDSVDAPLPELDELILIAPGEDAAALTTAAERGVIIAEGANLARDLSNRASNDASPEVLAEESRAIARRHDLWIDVIEPERATELGMGMFMAVGRGSDNPPRMILLR